MTWHRHSFGHGPMVFSVSNQDNFRVFRGEIQVKSTKIFPVTSSSTPLIHVSKHLNISLNGYENSIIFIPPISPDHIRHIQTKPLISPHVKKPIHFGAHGGVEFAGPSESRCGGETSQLWHYPPNSPYAKQHHTSKNNIPSGNLT